MIFFVLFFPEGGIEFKLSLSKQTGTLWPCLSSTKRFCFSIPDSGIVQCGAEAHSHQVDNATPGASVCLRWAGTDKTHTLSFSFYFALVFCPYLLRPDFKKDDWIGSEMDHFAV